MIECIIKFKLSFFNGQIWEKREKLDYTLKTAWNLAQYKSLITDTHQNLWKCLISVIVHNRIEIFFLKEKNLTRTLNI